MVDGETQNNREDAYTTRTADMRSTVGEDSSTNTPSRREIYEATLSGAWDYGQRLPLLRSDPRNRYLRLAHSLEEFRAQEGEKREKRWREVWWRLQKCENAGDKRGDEKGAWRGGGGDGLLFTRERATELKEIYESELIGRCRGSPPDGGSGECETRGSVSPISWTEFCEYAEAKEVELWHIFHHELDLDGNGHLDSAELGLALKKAGIPLSSNTLSEFMSTLTASPHSHAISFREFRDFLLLLPRQVSTVEIYQYYEMKKYLGEDWRGAARLTMEGDVSLSGEDEVPSISITAPGYLTSASISPSTQTPPVDHKVFEPEAEHHDQEGNDQHENHTWLLESTAVRYLLAGGVAGAVSRTCTAPFDRLKIFLITRPEEIAASSGSSRLGMKAIVGAVSRIYAENGILGFWIGNGLSVAKILPESAIKFMSYETSKRFFAKYWDHVEDPREISQVSRFLSGGLGGIASQLSIYPIETVKTQMMSSTGGRRQKVLDTVKRVHTLGGPRAFYRGLIIGLVGVFPYSAIDMSTFEALKLAYVQSTGKEEPGVLALLSFGSLSGSVGACSVYPLNLVRTRLQASGSPAHPKRYTGIWDVVSHTYKQSGVRGFYIGLGPTLAKVIPAVSISYVVYEHSKRRLGVY